MFREKSSVKWPDIFFMKTWTMPNLTWLFEMKFTLNDRVSPQHSALCSLKNTALSWPGG